MYGILAILAAFSVWPYLRTVGFEPMAFDDAVWISRGLWGRPDWADWVWGTRQLGVGYRPVTALTYTLDSALAGFAMPLYRCTDLLLHVAAGMLVFAVFRRLARDTAGSASPHDLFLDNDHLTVDGHRVVAELLKRPIADPLHGRAPASGRP